MNQTSPPVMERTTSTASNGTGSSRRPLNVLWLIDHVCYDGSLHGGGRLFRNLVPEFDPAAVRVFPYFLRASNEVRHVFADAPVPVTTLDKSKYDPTTLTTVLGFCRRHRIDVMHLFCYASSTFGRLAGVLRNVPTVIHDFDTQIYFPYPWYLRWTDRLLAPSTGRALAASPTCRAYMHEVRRVPLERIELMSHAVPEARFAAAERADPVAIRAGLGWRPDEIVYAVATKLGPDRGNEYLLRAFARVAAECAAARLVLVYKPTYYHRVPEQYAGLEWIRDVARMRRDVDALVAELGLGGRVRLVESLDNPEPYLLAADAVVVPFLHERFSSVNLLEAFAYGRPAVVTELGEQRELVVHERNGLLVTPGDEAELAAAMVRLAADPALRRRLGDAARATAAEHSIGAVARRLGGLYRTLARAAGRLGPDGA